MSEPPAKGGPARERSGDSTRSVHGGERAHQASDAVTTPIYQTSTFWFKDSAELREYQEGRAQRDEYGRYGNPTWRAVERKLCELEGAEQAVLFASGMCAATTLFLELLPRGSHLIVTSDCYRRTRQFIRQYLSKLDVETTVIDPADTKQLADAIRPETRLFFTESPTNPYLRVIDVAEAARVAHARGVGVVIDSTFASPVNHRALADGADLVIHSATKYLGGHNDLLCGVVLGSAEQVAPIRAAVGVLGGIPDANSAYLLLRGLKTLALRMQRHNANGLRVARFLEAHPRIRRVWYPGLAEPPRSCDRLAHARRLRRRRHLRGGYGPRGLHALHRRLPHPVHRAESRRCRIAGRDAGADVVLGRRARRAPGHGHHGQPRALLAAASRTRTTWSRISSRRCGGSERAAADASLRGARTHRGVVRRAGRSVEGRSVPTWPSGPGARCARTTARTATPGSPSRTITRARAPTAGARTASPACAISSSACASPSRSGTGATRS